jgi:hypothetical protein
MVREQVNLCAIFHLCVRYAPVLVKVNLSSIRMLFSDITIRKASDFVVVSVVLRPLAIRDKFHMCLIVFQKSTIC